MQVIDFNTGFAITGAGAVAAIGAVGVVGMVAGGDDDGEADGVGSGALGASNFTFKVGEENVKLLALR